MFYISLHSNCSQRTRLSWSRQCWDPRERAMLLVDRQQQHRNGTGHIKAPFLSSGVADMWTATWAWGYSTEWSRSTAGRRFVWQSLKRMSNWIQVDNSSTQSARAKDFSTAVWLWHVSALVCRDAFIITVINGSSSLIDALWRNVGIGSSSGVHDFVMLMESAESWCYSSETRAFNVHMNKLSVHEIFIYFVRNANFLSNWLWPVQQLALPYSHFK